VLVCVRGEEERNERWIGSGRVDQAKAGRPGRNGPRWAGQAGWASAYWPVNPSPALVEKKKKYLILEFLEIDNNTLQVFKNELKMIFEYYL
jgi:hypothetical protein